MSCCRGNKVLHQLAANSCKVLLCVWVNQSVAVCVDWCLTDPAVCTFTASASALIPTDPSQIPACCWWIPSPLATELSQPSNPDWRWDWISAAFALTGLFGHGRGYESLRSCRAQET